MKDWEAAAWHCWLSISNQKAEKSCLGLLKNAIIHDLLHFPSLLSLLTFPSHTNTHHFPNKLLVTSAKFYLVQSIQIFYCSFFMSDITVSDISPGFIIISSCWKQMVVIKSHREKVNPKWFALIHVVRSTGLSQSCISNSRMPRGLEGPMNYFRPILRHCVAWMESSKLSFQIKKRFCIALLEICHSAVTSH